MHFTKIKDDGKQVTLRWDTAKGETVVHHELESRERPAAEFRAVLADFVMPVLDLLQLPPEYAHEFAVVGLAINREEKDGRLGLVVTCFKKLEETNAPLVLNTPHLREYVDGDPDGHYLPSVMLRRIKRAELAAEHYVDGTREQLSLLGTSAG